MVKKYNPSWTFPSYDPDPFWTMDVATGRWVARPPAERHMLDPRIVRDWGNHPVIDSMSSLSIPPSSSAGRASTIPAQQSTTSVASRVQQQVRIANGSAVIKAEPLSSMDPGNTAINGLSNASSISFAQSMNKGGALSKSDACRTNADSTGHSVPESPSRAAEAFAKNQRDVDNFNCPPATSKKATARNEPQSACASNSSNLATDGNAGTPDAFKEAICANLDRRGSVSGPANAENATASRTDASLDDSRIDPTCRACTTKRHVAHTCGRGLSRFRKRYAGFVPALHKVPSREEGMAVRANELAAAEAAQKLCKACTTRRHVAHTCGRRRPVGKKRKNVLKALQQEGLCKEVAARMGIAPLQSPNKQFVCGACGAVFRTSQEILIHHAHQQCAAAEYPSGPEVDEKGACSGSPPAKGSADAAKPAHTPAGKTSQSTLPAEPFGKSDFPDSKRMKSWVPKADAVTSRSTVGNVAEEADRAPNKALEHPKTSQDSEDGVFSTLHPAIAEPVPGSRAFVEVAPADSYSSGSKDAAPVLYPRLPEDDSRPPLPEEVKQLQMSATSFIAHVQLRFCQTPSMYVAVETTYTVLLYAA